MEVVAVSWSTPKWHNIHGTPTLTSIVREPKASINVGSDGIQDNIIAAHDAQIYAFLAHHYAYWQDRLGLSRSDWKWCHWGENIVFRTNVYMDEHDFRLGDVWRVGNDVLLQVCGARIPCSKLSWRCGQEDKWLKELADSGFCGMYLKILTPGIIRPGDRAVQIERNTDTASVASITQLAFDGSLTTKDTLNLLVDDPNLLSMNKLLFKRKLSIMHDRELLGQNHWNGWRTFRPVKIVDECQDIKSFYLEPIDGLPLATYLPGQFLTVRLPNGLVHSWSISDFPGQDAPSYYRLSIKRSSVTDTGQSASNWMHCMCNEKTKLFIRSPSGSFFLDWTPMFSARQIYMSAGIGLTPILSMLKAHLMHYSTKKAPAIWIHIVKGENFYPQSLVDEVFKFYNDEIRPVNLLQIHIFWTAIGESSPPILSRISAAADGRTAINMVNDDPISHHHGRPKFEFLKDLLDSPYEINPLNTKPITLPGNMSTIYICGPSSFESSMKSALIDAGMPSTLIRTESFTPTTKAITNMSQATIRFTLSNRNAEWRALAMGHSPSLLETAESVGLTPSFGCRVGSCGSCKAKLLKGSVSGGVQVDGSILICCAKPTSGIVELEI